MGKEYKYDAFISYRHSELDQYVAELIHRKMESYKPPKEILNNEAVKKTQIKRVFRDKEELPLSSNLEDQVVDALRESEYLIVICSPRLKESLWCKKEIKTFIKMHGRKNILAVLIEGEPKESFPDELLYEDIKKAGKKGESRKALKMVEPLAADLRATGKGKIKKQLRTELLRLLAPMFGVSFDDLKQRQKERKVRKTIIGCALAAAVGVVVSIASISTALYIQSQNNQIEAQNELLAREQAKTLANLAIETKNQDNREESIAKACSALTTYNGVKMPYTPEAERALYNCLNVYEVGLDVCPYKQIQMPGVVEKICVSPNGKYLLSSDNLDNLILWDLTSKKKIYQAENTVEGLEFAFVSDNSFYYETLEGETVEVKIDGLEKKVVKATIDPRIKYKDKLSGTGVVKYIEYGGVYYFSGINTDNITDEKSIVIAIEKESGKVIFSKKLDGVYTPDIALSRGTGGKHVVVYGDTQAIMLDAQTGTYLETFKFGESIASCLPMNDGGFCIYTANGSCQMISGKAPYKVNSYAAIICHDVKQFVQTTEGLVGIRKNDSRITIYTYLGNKDGKEYKGSLAKPITKGKMKEKAAEWAAKTKLKKSSLINYYLEVEEIGLVFVGYADNTIEVYSAKDMKCISNCEDCINSNLNYYGKIGPYYVIGCDYYAYLFDKEGKIHGEIPHFKGVTQKRDAVVVYGKNDKREESSYSLPVYSTDELLKKAQEYLAKEKKQE